MVVNKCEKYTSWLESVQIVQLISLDASSTGLFNHTKVKQREMGC